MKRPYIVACTEHGPMSRDEAACGWVCTAPRCCTYLPDADVFRLVTAAPVPPRRKPVRVMVSDHCVQRAAELPPGPDWQTSPATQIRWGLNYIKTTYGPGAAP